VVVAVAVAVPAVLGAPANLAVQAAAGEIEAAVDLVLVRCQRVTAHYLRPLRFSSTWSERASRSSARRQVSRGLAARNRITCFFVAALACDGCFMGCSTHERPDLVISGDADWITLAAQLDVGMGAGPSASSVALKNAITYGR
jgi:hypothetical protein